MVNPISTEVDHTRQLGFGLGSGAHPISTKVDHTLQDLKTLDVQSRLVWLEANAVGLAMVSRGEIGYLMALQLVSTQMISSEVGGYLLTRTRTLTLTPTLISSEVYGYLLWALTLCTVLSPPFFAFLLRSKSKIALQL